MKELVPPQYAINAAVEAALCSPCVQKRGASIYSPERQVIESTGFNHPPLGFHCGKSYKCKMRCMRENLHAEQAAIMSVDPKEAAFDCDLVHVKVIDGSPVACVTPNCLECSKFINLAGIRGVWLLHEAGWKRYSAAEFHSESVKAYRTGYEEIRRKKQPKEVAA